MTSGQNKLKIVRRQRIYRGWFRLLSVFHILDNSSQNLKPVVQAAPLHAISLRPRYEAVRRQGTSTM